jgi:hypothetical protein
MLWELSVTVQRYRAVLGVLAGVPVTEVADRYGMSHPSVHASLHYRQEGITRLEDCSLGFPAARRLRFAQGNSAEDTADSMSAPDHLRQRLPSGSICSRIGTLAGVMPQER